MHQLLLLLAVVSSVSASANPKKKVVKAMEGCKLVWEEEENCVTESNVEICRMKDTQHCEEVSKIVCHPIVAQDKYRVKREVLVEKHKNTGKLLMPLDLRSIHEHFDLEKAEATAPYYPLPKQSPVSNLLPLHKVDHRHQNLVSGAVVSYPSPLAYQDEDDLFDPSQDGQAPRKSHAGIRAKVMTEECSPVVEKVCTTVPKEACHKGTQEVCTKEKVAKEVCPKGRVEKFLGKIGHKIKRLLEKLKKW